ncbi:bacteriophage protein [Burkholderia pseudomallei]|nr:bacteriophage protein [Burkholderia pseudomallei]
MAKLIKPFKGVKNGEIYPTLLEVGEECPPELEDGARELGALEGADNKKPATAKK